MRIISPNKIIGSLVYRTAQALDGNAAFMGALQATDANGAYVYPFVENILSDGKFHLWHYPGTHEEISASLLALSGLPNGERIKFPSILNFHPIDQRKDGRLNRIHFTLSIASWTLSQWTTEQREVSVFDPLLRPIYGEFMEQVINYPHFQLDYGIPPHSCIEIFTTGKNAQAVTDRYGEHIDAIELHSFYVDVVDICERDYEVVEYENSLVTQDINELLKI